jgi:predicted SAM-dependent methyltransferase
MYSSETQKIRPSIQKHLSGLVVDIGCGHDPVTPDAFGIDCRKFPHVKHVTRNLDRLSQELPHLKADVVYSSHCLEHFADDLAAARDWLNLLKPNGLLVLYLPDDRHYNNAANPDHLQRYTYPQFMNEFVTQLQVTVIESGEDFGDDRYSFYCVLQRTL